MKNDNYIQIVKLALENEQQISLGRSEEKNQQHTSLFLFRATVHIFQEDSAVIFTLFLLD